MNKDYLIRLTLGVYELSEWWPESNLLKVKLRNLANEILIDFILIIHENPKAMVQPRLLGKIEDFQRVLKIVRIQKLVDRPKFLLFQKEYSQLSQIIKGQVQQKPEEKEKIKLEIGSRPVKKAPDLNERQNKILDILKQKQRIQVWQIQEFLPQTSKRTLRRDLDGLMKKGLIRRKGEWNEVFYVLADKVIGQG